MYVCVCLFKSDALQHPCTDCHQTSKPTKDFLGKVLKPMSISKTYQKGLIGRAALRSCHGFFHDCSNMTVWPRTNLLHYCEREHKITTAQKSAAAEPVLEVHTAILRHMYM